MTIVWVMAEQLCLNGPSGRNAARKDAVMAKWEMVAQDVQPHHKDGTACVAAQDPAVSIKDTAQKVKALLLGRCVPTCFARHGQCQKDIVTDGEGLWDQIDSGEIIESGNSWFGIEK